MTNFADRTIWAGDNLDILRGLNSASVDLIYLHPPFNSNQDYAAPVGRVAAGAVFKDTWTLSDLDVAWMGLIADEQPAMYKVLEAAGLTHGKGMQSYLCMMAVRLLEMRRVLKDSGSIYLYCDPTASHYLKLLMDSIYGDRNFRSEIIWKQTTAHNDGAQGRRQHGRVHDVLFFYTKSDQWTWNTIYTDYEPEYVARFSLIEPETNRRYTLDNLTGPGGASKGNPRYAVMGITRYWRYSEECMQQLIAAGRIVQSRPGAVPRYKRYLDEMPGLPLQDSWVDIAPINSQAKERIGYPTQKPLALLERSIRASSTGSLPPGRISRSAPISSSRCHTVRTSICCSVSRRAGATDAAVSSHSEFWRSTTSSPSAPVARTTSRTCSYCAPTATGSRATGRRSTW